MGSAAIGGLVAQFLISLLVGYVCAGISKGIAKAPNPMTWIVWGAIGAFAPAAISLARDEVITWIGALLAAAFFFLRYLRPLLKFNAGRRPSP